MAFKEKNAPVKEKDAAHSELARRFKSNPLLFIGTVLVLVFVIVAFVFPNFIGSGGGGRVDLTFGYYDKTPISYVPGNYFSRYLSMLEQYRRNSIDPNDQFAYYQLWNEAFEAAAVNTAALQEMKKSGYTAPVKIVDRQVAQLPQYQENGRFSETLYRRYDDNERLTHWQQVQDEITAERYNSDITGLLKSSAEAAFVGDMASPQRSFDMAWFPIDEYPDSEYASFAEENPELFKDIHLSIITVSSSEREARQILKSIKDDTTAFEDAAKNQSKDSYAEKGGDMGIKMAYELRAEVPDEAAREKLFSLARGEFSDVIKLDSGWAFFRVEDEARAADVSDTAVFEKIRSYVKEFERGRIENYVIAQAEDFIAAVKESGFDQALSAAGREKRSFGPLPVNYGNIDLFTTLTSFSASAPELSSSSSDENFWKAAFSTPLETPSEPLVQGNNVLVFFPTAETSAEESKIEDIASAWNSYWLSYMTEQSIRSFVLNSAKFKNNFFETYMRYLMPKSN